MRREEALREKREQVQYAHARTVDGREVDPLLSRLEGEGSAIVARRPEEAWPAPVEPRLDDQETYYGLPAIKQPRWKAWIPTYLFVGGAAGASLALGGAAQLFGRDDAGMRALVVRGRWLGAIGCAASAGLLVADLGRPARFLNMLRVFRPTSPMNVGAWVLSAAAATSAAAALFGRSRTGDAAGLFAALSGLPLAGYTAVLLSSSVVPVWARARVSMPVLFIGSAMASAASLLELLPPASPSERAALRAFGNAGRAIELAGASALEREVGDDVVRRPLREGAAGMLFKAARILTAASLALSLLPRGRRAVRLGSALLGVAGALSVRFAMMRAGTQSALDPRATLRAGPPNHRLGKTT